MIKNKNNSVDLYRDFWHHVEISLNCMGISRFNTKPVSTLKRRLLNAYFGLLMLWIFYGTSSLTFYLIHNFVTLDDYLQISTIISYLSYTWIAMVKTFRMLKHSDVIKELLQQLQNRFPSEGEQRDYPSIGRVVVDTRQWMQRHILIQYCFFSYSGISLNSFISLMAAGLAYLRNGPPFERRFPYIQKQFISVENLGVYIGLYCFEAILGIIASVMNVVSDVVFFYFIIQLIIQFETIAVKLREFKPSSVVDRQSEEDRKFMTKIVDQHSEALEMVDKVNSVFQFLVFFNFFTAMSILIFMGFLLKYSVDNLTLIKNLLLLIYSIVQIWLMSTLSTKLKEASISVVNAAYEQEWFNANINYQKSLRIIITRAQEPAVIKGYFFKSVDMEDFTDVIMASYKFLTALNALAE